MGIPILWSLSRRENELQKAVSGGGKVDSPSQKENCACFDDGGRCNGSPTMERCGGGGRVLQRNVVAPTLVSKCLSVDLISIWCSLPIPPKIVPIVRSLYKSYQSFATEIDISNRFRKRFPLGNEKF